MTKHLIVLSAGMGTPSSTRLLADQLTRSSVAALAAEGHPAEVEVIELRELIHEITDALTAHFPSGRLEEAVASLRAADGVIAVTPVFNASYSGLFKLFFDVLDENLLAGKPLLMGATAGTPRHSLVLEFALRPLFAYLKADTVPTAVFAASEDFGATSAEETTAPATLTERADRGGRELAQRMAQYDAGMNSPDDEFADFVPMGQLLGGR